MYAKIAEISTVNAKGNTVSFQLYEDGAVEPSPMPKLPVTGYRLRFKLSDFGFGILNTTLSLDLLDDELNTYYNRFNAVKRLDYAIRVTIGSNEIFWGFINFKQIERKLFKDKPNEIKITCYNPLSYLSTIAVTDKQAFDIFGDVVVPNLANEGRISNDAVNCMRIGRLLTNFAFKLFNNQPDFITNLPYFCENANLFNSTLSAEEQNIINAGYFKIDKFIDDEGGSDSILEMLTNVMRTLFMRCGWSYSQQKPMAVASHDVGLYASDFLRFTTLKPLATIGGTADPYIIVNTVVDYDLVGTAILEKNKFLRGATNRGINPLSVIIYKQGTPILGSAVSGNVTIDENKLILNVNGIDASQGDVYESDELAFVSSPDDTLGLGTFFIPTGDDSTQFFDVPGKYSGIGQVILEELLTQIHEILRSQPKERLQFVYDSILDPMINYGINFNTGVQISIFTNLVVNDGGFVTAPLHTANVLSEFKEADLLCTCSAGATNKLYFTTIDESKYIITDGEYDLLLEQTVVSDSYQI